MNRALLVLCVALVGAQAAYPEYELRQQSAGGYRGPPVVPVILPGGFIADTEEVAKAKSLHFNAFAHAASAVKDTNYNAAEEDYNSQPRYTQAAAVRQPSYAPQHYSAPQQVYRAAQPLYGHDVPQRQQDYNVPQHKYTGPAASSEETYTNAKPIVNYQPSYSPQQIYQGPPAVPVILPNGYLADTHDVEAAKEHHFQLVAQAQAAVARAQERAKTNYRYTAAPAAYSRQDDEGQYEEQSFNQVYQAAPSTTAYRSAATRQPYQGPPAVPVVLPSGHIADTAEVAAAKISHLQQLLDAAQKSLPQQRYNLSR